MKCKYCIHLHIITYLHNYIISYSAERETDSKSDYRPAFMDHFDIMCQENKETGQTIVEEEEEPMQQEQPNLRPPKKFNLGDFDFVSHR